MIELERKIAEAPYLFDVVFEAKVRVMVQITRKYRPTATLDDIIQGFKLFAAEEWERLERRQGERALRDEPGTQEV